MATVNPGSFVVILEMMRVSFPGFEIFSARDLLDPMFTFPKSSERLSISIAAEAVPEPMTKTVSGPKMELL